MAGCSSKAANIFRKIARGQASPKPDRHGNDAKRLTCTRDALCSSALQQPQPLATDCSFAEKRPTSPSSPQCRENIMPKKRGSKMLSRRSETATHAAPERKKQWHATAGHFWGTAYTCKALSCIKIRMQQPSTLAPPASKRSNSVLSHRSLLPRKIGVLQNCRVVWPSSGR